METLRPTGIRPVSPGQLAWLNREVRQWTAAGTVDDAQAAAILAGYRAVRRWSLAALGLWLGAGFVGVGVIWLVAANLDRFPPLARFAVVAALWLGSVAAAELLARRLRTRGSAVVGGLRGLAALLYGAVIFQAAQSLQVPAWEPVLLGIWGAGALLYAYAVRGLAALVVGVVMTTSWLVWQLTEQSESPLGAVLAFGTLGVAGFALGRLHAGSAGHFASVWRLAGALGALVSLFIAALPWGYELDESGWLGWAAAGAALVLAALAVVRSTGSSRLEAVAGVLALAAALGIGVWSSSADDGVGAGDWGRAIVSVLAFVLVAAAVAAVGVLRDEPHLTWLAVAALTVFTTVQGFSVFAEIITGAWLFVALGVLFAGTGWIAERGRREMADALEGAER